MDYHRSILLRRATLTVAVVVAPLLLLGAVLVGFDQQANASSHREAPLISKDAYADNTDTYVFISPENQNNVVMVGSSIPFEGPEGGPNYYEWDDNALYDLYVDNDGDTARLHLHAFEPGAGRQPGYLPVQCSRSDLGDTDWNRKQYYTVTETAADGVVSLLVANQPVAPVHIGEKSTPDYDTLEQESFYDAAEVPAASRCLRGRPTIPSLWTCRCSTC